MRTRYSPKMSLKRSAKPQDGNPGGQATPRRSAKRILASPKRMVMAMFVVMLSAMLLFVAVGLAWPGGATGVASIARFNGKLVNVTSVGGRDRDAWGFTAGARSYVTVPDRGLYGRSQVWSGWIQINGGSGWQTVFFKGNTRDCQRGCQNREVALFYNTGGRYFHLTSTPVGYPRQIYLNTRRVGLRPNTWYHFSAVVNTHGRAYMSFALNGREIGSRSYPNRPIKNTHGALWVGNNPTWNGQLVGGIDELTFQARGIGIHSRHSFHRHLYTAAARKADRPVEKEAPG